MTENYQQFLGSSPGLLVELIDGEKSPFKVRTKDGFEFWLSSDDFRNYYKAEESATTEKWGIFITDKALGVVETCVAREVVDLINRFKGAFQDFMKARHFLKDLIKNKDVKTEADVPVIRDLLKRFSKFPEVISDKDIRDLLLLSPRARDLLASPDFAVLDWPLNHSVDLTTKNENAEKPKKEVQKKTPRTIPQRMKNVEFILEDNTLIIKVDVSKEFGPSKSGKTTIVASTEGNKTIPGRVEKVGLNIYKEISEAKKTGNKTSFKNMEMQLDGHNLTITVDLSQEFGPSKSGKTIIIASTGGNQLVYGRSEKIGLNVYKTL
ncbi:MAG: hypothetical protein NTY51_03390 [Deltaproteobacteria bacterium]|nr:hypothetical protein [Deltaproteobacteria bacterium]